ncbi:hypothetical protein HDU84_004034 [Entophlyctis sp. JEL0112]|nr:hypothetical protein HDU84_004034 [Entophlyctis sp. JEL0112]
MSEAILRLCGTDEYSWRLLELPSAIAESLDPRALSDLGDRQPALLTIRGDEDCDAVLTTSVLSPRQMLLILPQRTRDAAEESVLTIRACLNDYVSIDAANPATRGIVQSIFRKWPVPHEYNGPDTERRRTIRDTGSMITLATLRDKVCASDAEFVSALKDLGIFELDGICRMISIPFLKEFVFFFISAIQIEGRDIHDHFTEREAVLMMAEHEFPDAVIVQCLRLISDSVGEPIYMSSHEYRVTIARIRWKTQAVRKKDLPGDWLCNSEGNEGCLGYSLATLIKFRMKRPLGTFYSIGKTTRLTPSAST